MNQFILRVFPALTGLFGSQFTLDLAKTFYRMGERFHIRLPFALVSSRRP